MKTTPITMMLLLLNFLLCYSCESKELETIADQPQAKSKTMAKNVSLIGEQREYTFSPEAGGERSYYISVPEDYDDAKKYRLVFVFAGTDSTGEFMHEWMGQGWNSNTPGLEKLMDNTIFVYPDQKYIWGNGTGWALGSYAGQYGGMHDIQFTKELLALIKNEYTIDNNRIFATGHSWGGDMTNVTAYFLNGVFKAIAPIASNRPFWFENSNGNYVANSNYHGNTAVWVFFGLNDDHFGNTSPNGLFGIQQADFWRLKNGTSSNPMSTPIGSSTDVTKTYGGGTAAVKLTLYKTGQYSGGGTLLGHQPPDYYFKAVTDWFKTF
ncbi:alpha/beta hydrolase family esterase [Chryseobacterium paridis]|uniref:Peptidase S9 prolyl oligopeptidase catalytic domain-containing protein n=1 Tax=Chryseobacterium paridis TaxID=2800328 RepID=A0ABS1FWE5_9FLAO|nr:prolyl oligopeptidase family serine peptidase [Chryseobacterium paridis]MBK1896720.1 hypothetical protein [Chryseobacterium paridis]